MSEKKPKNLLFNITLLITGMVAVLYGMITLSGLLY